MILRAELHPATPAGCTPIQPTWGVIKPFTPPLAAPPRTVTSPLLRPMRHTAINIQPGARLLGTHTQNGPTVCEERMIVVRLCRRMARRWWTALKPQRHGGLW
jgi:hypothetical protein